MPVQSQSSHRPVRSGQPPHSGGRARGGEDENPPPIPSSLAAHIASGTSEAEQQLKRLDAERAALRRRIVVINLDDAKVPEIIRLWLETDARRRLGNP